MSYKVVRFFTDLQDNGFAYNPGDKFPRDGKEVTETRLKELSSVNNRQGKILIEKIEEVPEGEPETFEEPKKKSPAKKRSK